MNKIINKTAIEYVKEQKQEFFKNPEDAELWNDNFIPQLRNEYFNIIIEELNKGNKITQNVYNDLINDNMNEYYLNKHYLKHGIKIIEN